MAIAENIAALRETIRDCTLCPRACHVDRTAGQIGACGVGEKPIVASAGPHFGEEPVVVGGGGSGTIFLAGCNLDCVFCQNVDISRHAVGRTMAVADVARTALGLVDAGCVNVNFVSPSHVAHAVAETVATARGEGLTVPIVYNSGGYDAVETLRRLEGMVEIYMPDFKWADAEAGRRYSGVADYPSVAEEALAEMFRQVGRLETGDGGVATRGVLVRHLVMPNDLVASRGVLETVARVAPGCAVNVMGQYRSAHRAAEYPRLRGRPSRSEVAELRDHAESLGLVRVD